MSARRSLATIRCRCCAPFSYSVTPIPAWSMTRCGSSAVAAALWSNCACMLDELGTDWCEKCLPRDCVEDVRELVMSALKPPTLCPLISRRWCSRAWLDQVLIEPLDLVLPQSQILPKNYCSLIMCASWYDLAHCMRTNDKRMRQRPVLMRKSGQHAPKTLLFALRQPYRFCSFAFVSSASNDTTWQADFTRSLHGALSLTYF